MRYRMLDRRLTVEIEAKDTASQLKALMRLMKTLKKPSR